MKRDTAGPSSRMHPGLIRGGLAILALLSIVLVYRYAQTTHAAYVTSLLDRSNDQLNHGHPQDAAETLTTILREEPDNAAALDLIAKVYVSGQRFDLAVKPLTHLVEIRPQTPGAYGNLAECLRATGDLQGARLTVEQGLRENPNELATLAAAADIFHRGDDSARALDAERKLHSLAPSDVNYCRQLAISLVKDRLFAEALQVIDNLMRLVPDDPTALTLRGESRYYTDQSAAGVAAAEGDLKRVLQLTPGAYYPNLFLGRIYVRRREPKRAIACLLAAEQRIPGRGDPEFVLSQAYDQTGEKALAERARRDFSAWRNEIGEERALEKRLALVPDDFSGNLRLARIKLKHRDLEKARFYASRALRLNPENPDAVGAAKEIAGLVSLGGNPAPPIPGGE